MQKGGPRAKPEVTSRAVAQKSYESYLFLELEGRVQTPGLFSFQTNWLMERRKAVGQNEGPTLAQQEWSTSNLKPISKASAPGT
jgi:hypothetical protein